MQDDVTIGARIKQVRTDNGLTQDAFGKPLGVTRGAVANWERGLGIKRDNLLAIAERFQVSFDWLATGNYNSISPPVSRPLDGICVKKQKTALNALAGASMNGPVFDVNRRLVLSKSGAPIWDQEAVGMLSMGKTLATQCGVEKPASTLVGPRVTFFRPAPLDRWSNEVSPWGAMGLNPSP